MKRFWKIFNVVTWVIVVATVTVTALLTVVRLIGYRPLYVMSPSMSPEYNVNDLIFVRHVDPETVEVGDVISFVYDSSLRVVTHRVVEIDTVNRRFITKGDANKKRDGAIRFENCLGVVRYSVPKLGKVAAFIQSKKGKYVMAAYAIMLVMLLILPEIFDPDAKKQGKKSAEDAEN